MRAILAVGAVTLALSGCSGGLSTLNPVNWFGTSVEDQSVDGRPLRPLLSEKDRRQSIDTRVFVRAVTSLTVERTANGALIVARGTVPTAGYSGAELVLTKRDSGQLTYEFRVVAPSNPLSATQQTIIAAESLSDSQLLGISRITVAAATNTRTTRR